MNLYNRSLIIGKGKGISNFLSRELKIDSYPSKVLKDLNLTDYDNIIYTSTDPSHNISFGTIPLYLEKNIRSIYHILESNFRGKLTYLSSIDSGPYNVFKENQKNQIEDMYTSYSFCKLMAESLLASHSLFEKCTILRLGLLWPTTGNSNFFNAVESDPQNINLNLNSSYYLTPYSLVLKYLINRNYISKDKCIIGYLSSSNKINLSLILKLRGINLTKNNNFSYCYMAKDRDPNINNLTEDKWFNWEEEDDFNHLIAKGLTINGNEQILPYK